MLELIKNGKIVNIKNIFYCLNEKNELSKYFVTPPYIKPLKEYPIERSHTQYKYGIVYQNRWDGNFRHFIIETFYILSKFP